MPPLNTDERTTLESWLDFHRATLARKCEGLDDEQAASASTRRTTRQPSAPVPAVLYPERAVVHPHDTPSRAPGQKLSRVLADSEGKNRSAVLAAMAAAGAEPG